MSKHLRNLHRSQFRFESHHHKLGRGLPAHKRDMLHRNLHRSQFHFEPHHHKLGLDLLVRMQNNSRHNQYPFHPRFVSRRSRWDQKQGSNCNLLCMNLELECLRRLCWLKWFLPVNTGIVLGPIYQLRRHNC
ncbi:MAG: hypothetical protein BWY19_00427 [bacterium ADurb.Bin212]|nr:MAG: hypothetical protein BWY19_00427 [bacterium ADurb.Bin212]